MYDKNIFDFQNSTKTHCEVENFAPSISAAIGSFLPQKYVWQVAIALHIVPRFLFLWMYKQFYKSRISVITPRIYWLIQVTIGFNLLELVSLLGLTLVSSQEDFDTHKACFVTFGISGTMSQIYFVKSYIKSRSYEVANGRNSNEMLFFEWVLLLWHFKANEYLIAKCK